jgi:hypothetical protein
MRDDASTLAVFLEKLEERLYEQERDCIPESLQTTTWEKMAESAKTWKPCEDMSA